MASSILHYSFLFLSLMIFSQLLSHHAIAQSSSRPRALILPVTKDLSTRQYVAEIQQRTPLVPVKLAVDLGGEKVWVDDGEHGYSSSSYRPVRCNSAQCNLARSKACAVAVNECSDFPFNAFTKRGTGGTLAEDVVSVRSTDGRPVTVPRLIFIRLSHPKFMLEGLAGGVTGIAALGRTQVSLPAQFSRTFGFARKFAVCLGSSNGVVFFGDGPYNFLPRPIDFSKSLVYTPLLINPVPTGGGHFLGDGTKSADYFIGVKSIKINGVKVPLNTTLLNIDSKGNGGTKISTVHPFTVMETSIYKAFTEAFIKQVGNVPRVAPVAPFTTCYNASSFPGTRLGANVPQIDLVLQSENVFWRIVGANSMVEASENVLCLGFVDGGVEPRTSIVIGTHQFVDKLLQFDVATSRLGFSSTLLSMQTTCGNFNFTTVAN